MDRELSRAITFLVVLASLLLTASCGSGDSGSDAHKPAGAVGATSPAGAARELVRSLEAGDCAAVKQIVLQPSAVECTTVSENEGTFADDGITLSNVVYTPGEVVGGSAKVAVKWGNGDPVDSFDVQKVDGSWLVLFDSAA